MIFISKKIKGEELQILHLFLEREISPAVTSVVVYGDNQLEH